MMQALNNPPKRRNADFSQLGWRNWFAFLLGSSLPTYLFDDGSGTKLWAALFIVISLSGLFLTSGLRIPDLRASAVDLAMLSFIISYSFAVAVASIMETRAPIFNYWYPVLFALIVFLRLQIPKQFLLGAFVSLFAIVSLGWFRFLTGTGGDEVEHLLGYWGIKYTAATRNNDVIAPLLLSMVALIIIGEHHVTSRWARMTILVTLVPSLLAVVLSFSRAAWVSLFSFFVFFFWLQVRHRKLYSITVKYLVLCTAGIFLIVWVSDVAEIDPWSLWTRLLSIGELGIDSSNFERWELIKYSFLLGTENPLLGAGAGKFSCCMSELGFDYLTAALHPENLLLNIHAEMGFVPAFTLGFALIGATVRGMRSSVIGCRAAAVVLATLLIWLQFNSELLSLFTWIVLGLTVRLTSTLGQPTRTA
jgi:hypothetical protein